jgi:hypothetical protein
VCITVVISPLDKRAGRIDPAALANSCGLLTESAGRGAVALCPPGECPCGFAVGDCATGAHWTIREDLKAGVISAVRFAAVHASRFRLMATWMDDPVPVERAVTLEELIQTIQRGVIAKSTFVVRSA